MLVGNNHAIESGIVELFAVAAIDDRFAVAPIVIDGMTRRPSGDRRRKRRITGARDERRASDDGRGFEEVASFHVFLSTDKISA